MIDRPPSRSPGPRWVVPFELVRATAAADGTAFIVREGMQNHSIFQPHAEVELRPDGFLAHVVYEGPKYPGAPRFMAFRLFAPLQENGRS